MRQGNVLLFAAAVVGVFSEFLPVLLANIPFTLTQTLTTHNICTYISLAIIAAMLLVLAVSMFVRWPHMPVDPRTVAGAAYYIADSTTMLRDFAGYRLSAMDRKQRDRYIDSLNRRYFYGRLVGSLGQTRMVVDGVNY
jgi:hypothetical protein